MMPLHMAASYGKGKEMVELLYENSQSMEGDLWTHESRSRFLLACVESDYFDVAIKVLDDHPELAQSGWEVLKVLAQNRRAFYKVPARDVVDEHNQLFLIDIRLGSLISDKRPALQLLRSMLKIFAKLPWPEVYDLMRGPADPINKENVATNPIDITKKYSSRVLFLAAEVGNIVFIVEIIRQYPELLNNVNDVNQSIFHVAISNRHVELYSLLNEMGSIKDRIVTLEDENGNNMLHLLAGIYTESAKSNCYDYIPEPPELLNQELLWFKEVENMLPKYLRKKKNAAGKTPREEFINNHKDLYRHSEKFIKDEISQLIVVAALLATISFAATITFPGGYNQDGYPVLSRNKLFPAFIIFNSTAFLSASASMICSLSLVTTTVDGSFFNSIVEDQLSMVDKVRKRLAGALFTLLISIVATIIAFMFNLFLLFEKSSPMLPKLSIGIITCLLFGISDLLSDICAKIFIGQKLWESKWRYARDWMPSTRSHDQVLFQNV